MSQGLIGLINVGGNAAMVEVHTLSLESHIVIEFAWMCDCKIILGIVVDKIIS